MNKLFLSCLAALLASLAACNEERSLTVNIANPLDANRQGEMVELSMAEVSERLSLPDTAQLVVREADGREVPYQITYDEKLIFPASVGPWSETTYRIQAGTPAPIAVKTCGKCYPERADDLAWENDLGGYRAYGPALQARGERGFGYDLFTKRNTDEPVLEEMYARELNLDSWKLVNELRQSDPQAAGRLRDSISYHVDHGYGMDCYAVGPTLGAGVSALMTGDTIHYPWCYRTCEILDNGPLRFTAKLTFHPFAVGGDTAVVETRLITLDAGSRLNRTAVSYANLSEPTPIVTGIVLHEPDGETVANADAGYMAYNDPTTGPGQGRIFVGAAFPFKPREAKPLLFSAEEKQQRNNADGQLLAISNYEPGSEYVYYWGFAWDRAEIKHFEDWGSYLKQFARQIRNPLEVTLR